MSTIQLIGLVVLLAGVALVVALVIRRARRGRAGSAPAPVKRPARPAPPERPTGSHQSPTFLPKRGPGLGAGSFITPLGGDGTPFEMTLLEVTQVEDLPNFGLTLGFALRNRNAFSLLVDIPILHTVSLDCDLERGFDADPSSRLAGHSVLDVQRQQLMFDRNNDNQLLFGPDETKAFAVQFDKTPRKFRSFDIEYALEAEGCPYGRYRLRYDFQTGRFTRRFLVTPLQRPW